MFKNGLYFHIYIFFVQCLLLPVCMYSLRPETLMQDKSSISMRMVILVYCCQPVLLNFAFALNKTASLFLSFIVCTFASFPFKIVGIFYSSSFKCFHVHTNTYNLYINTHTNSARTKFKLFFFFSSFHSCFVGFYLSLCVQKRDNCILFWFYCNRRFICV